MLIALAAFFVASACAPVLMKWLGRDGFFLAAIVPAIACGWLLTLGPDVLAGRGPEQFVGWVDGLGLHLNFRMDVLSWVMALLVTGVGALVLVYSARYFSSKATGLGRFAGFFLAFAGSMFGLVTTDNTLMMYVMWEATTVFSFLLIGHYRNRRASRRAAMQAIIITTMGGLAMLAGIVVLGQIPGGSYSFEELIASAQDGTLGIGLTVDQTVSSGVVTAAVVLVLVGAVSKSALFPFHFWLPAAMAAPTPVSAYLHAAAMVKAGVFLVARLAPAFADLSAWRWMLMILGVTTLLLGGYRALRQFDTKLILAYGTVSQLGLIMLLVGWGTAELALAGLAMVVSHALFKACLFLSVGIVDMSTGTRDLRELSGVGKKQPLLAVAAGIAVISMAGIPPLSGYVAKEAALHGLTYDGTEGMVIALLIGLGSALTLAYGVRFWWGCFSTKKDVPETEYSRRSSIALVPPVILATLSIVLGLLPGWWESWIAPYGTTLPGKPGHLTLWAGVGAAFWITVGVIVLGILIVLAAKPISRFQDRVEFPISADGIYRRAVSGSERVAADLTAAYQSGSLPMYLTYMLVTMVVGGMTALLLGGAKLPEEIRWFDSPAQVLVVIISSIAAILAARARRRLKAVLLLGVSGYGVATIFELHGAPDLALTQVLVETITLVVFVLVLRRLPSYFSDRPMVASRWSRAALGASVGLAAGLFAMVAAGARKAPPISLDFADEAYAYGYGKNIVNVTLVDIRAWDTMGEVSVVVVCAIGVASLLFIRDRQGRIDRYRNLPTADKSSSVWRRPEGGGQEVMLKARGARVTQAHQVRAPGRSIRWLPGTVTLAPQRRSVIFEVGTRLVYHTILILSVFFLFSGHNQPGGGFAGGLLAGIALTVRYLAAGRYDLGAALPVHPGILMGAGLFMSTTSALVPMFMGGSALQSAVFEFVLPAFGEVKLVTAVFFDVGVYFVVVGLVLDILRSLGAEIDRHGEIEGMDDDGGYSPAPSEDRRAESVDRAVSEQHVSPAEEARG